MWIIVLLVFGAGALYYGVNAGYFRGEAWGIAGSIALLIGVVCGLAAWYEVAWQFPADMASAVEVRAATANLGCGASEDVLGKAADFNALVAKGRVQNRQWLNAPFINDGIDTVTMIAIPNCKQ